MNTRIQYSDFHDVYIYYVEILPSNWENCEHQKTLECYCVARKKPITHEKTELQQKP